VEICALLVKEGEQRVDLDLRYIGFTIPPEFVVGYGLDVASATGTCGGSSLQGSRNVSVDVERVRAAVSEILIAIGEDPERDGLLSTPERVAAMYEELFSGCTTIPPAICRSPSPPSTTNGDGARHPVRLAL